MTTPTTIKLPDDLKKRVTREARSLGQSSHAFIVAAVERQTALARARREMFEAAARAEREFDDTGRHLTLDDLDRRLEAKLKGRRVRKTELKTWRKSSSPSAR